MEQTKQKYPDKNISICLSLSHADMKVEIFDIISSYTNSLYNLVANHSRLSNDELGVTYKAKGTADQILPGLLE